MSARLFKAGREVQTVPLSAFIGSLPAPDAAEERQGGVGTPAAHTPARTDPARQQAAAGAAEGAPAAPSPPAVTADAALEARRLLERARAEAAGVEEAARQHAAAVEREARERGLREAREHFDEAVADALRPWRDQLADSLAEVAALRAHTAARVEQELVRLALEIARKVVHREVHLDHEIATTLVRVALSRVNSRALARVRLNPADYAFVESRLAQLGSAGTIELVEDHTVGRGGCVVETETGDMDARIEQQFAEIERGLMTS